MATTLLENLEDLDGTVLLVVMLLLAIGEAAILLDLLVPGEVAMVVGGAVLAGQDGPVVAGMAVASIGAIIGDSLSFLAGATLGTRAVERWGFLQRRLGPPIERAHRYFARGGGPVVAVGRFVGALRAVVPFVAATSGMPYRRFLLWDVPAAIVWGSLMVGLGAAFGDDVARTVDRLDWWVTLAIVGVIVAWLMYRRVRKRRASSTAA